MLAFRHRSLPTLILLVGCALLPGCFSERSFPMVSSHLVHLQPAQLTSSGHRLTTRQWTQVAHTTATPLLPTFEVSALTTDSLSTNVFAHFHLNPAKLDNLFGNLQGLEQTAQVASPTPTRDDKLHIIRPPWPGFTDTLVPVSSGAILYARIGAPEPKNEIPGSYIIITHGLFGTLDGLDMENHVEALRHAGHHVLAIEMRGHGETACDHPEYVVSFGIQESADLLDAARWLKITEHATRVGLVSFSLTGYESLLAAWIDGATLDARFAHIPFLAGLPTPQPEPAFNAGMFIVSPPVDIVATADSFSTRYDMLDCPVKATFQKHIAERLTAFHQTPGFSMWDLAHAEFDRSGWEKLYGPYDNLKPDFITFIDMHAHNNWDEGVHRMENIRNPILLLAAANDPLADAQSVADLFSRVKNPNIGVIMLPGGGHMGFSALSADYYYSLMTNFFDPKTAPATFLLPSVATAQTPQNP